MNFVLEKPFSFNTRSQGQVGMCLHLKLGEIKLIQEVAWLIFVIKFQMCSFKENPLFAD